MGYGDNVENGRISRSPADLVWNLLTLLVMLTCVGITGLFALIFTYPTVPFNPFPPQKLPQLIIVPTFMPTESINTFPATWTPTVTALPTLTTTPITKTTTLTPYSIPATATLTLTVTKGTPQTSVTATQAGNMPFNILGNPVAVSSTIFHPELGCNWLGVGGQIFDLQGSPVVGYTIQLGGELGGNPINLLSLTGTALQYGPAGYEFTMSTKPVASRKTVWLQMLDQAGLPLSDKIYFDTYDDCQKNLIMISFRQVR